MSRDFNRACKIKTILNSRPIQDYKEIKKRIHEILSKPKSEISDDEKSILKQYKDIVRVFEARKQYQVLRKERELEVEDDPSVLTVKCGQLVDLIRSSHYIVVYAGAGISTSASIPDYRGPNGVWTQLKNGFNTPKVNDLVFAEPTYTHMALAELVSRNIVKHIVSQNCDGLHLRSGVPSKNLSEIHGNMFIEICKCCKKQYIRSFDVTEKTALRRHITGRKCHTCSPEEGILIDTIVHFGEKGKIKFPLNWEAASETAKKADLIICLGSSLKILRKYQCLWPKIKNKNSNQLVIVNLQWTPKDSQATIKINAKCDFVMREIMTALDIPVSPYDRRKDAIFQMNIPLSPEEETTCNRTKLDQIVVQEMNEERTVLSPGWFGKGIRKK
ncbi:NAD-dependent protein deacetylase sirtuin-7 [Blomia tropicalis]|nr:NAD-dependent protein deacetylase sirtuin-7 [Blomia tropicalis]